MTNTAALPEASGLLTSARSHPAVKILLADRCGADFAISRDIHPEDEILEHARSIFGGDWDQALVHYFNSGAAVFEAFRAIVEWKFGSLTAPKRVLDFACGFGRVTRFLKIALPEGTLSASEILPKAVAFQREHFGLEAFESVTDPRDLRIPGPFDVILVNSLFSHLPERTFAPWLARLIGLLAPGGLLIFSVHDQELYPNSIGRKGIRFHPSSESHSLDTRDYGVSWVTEEFVRRTVSGMAPESSCFRIPRAVLNHQDYYVLVREPGVDFSSLAFDRPPFGFFESAEIDGDDLRVTGWAAGLFAENPIGEVELRLGSHTVGECRNFGPRPDVAARHGNENLIRSSWIVEAKLPIESSRSFQPLYVRAASGAGASTPLYLGSIDGALLRAARQNESSGRWRSRILRAIRRS